MPSRNLLEVKQVIIQTNVEKTQRALGEWLNLDPRSKKMESTLTHFLDKAQRDS